MWSMLWFLILQCYVMVYGTLGASASLSPEILLDGRTDETYNGHLIKMYHLNGGYDVKTLCVQWCLLYTSGPACVAINFSKNEECQLLAPPLHPGNSTFTENVGWQSMMVTFDSPYPLCIPGSNHCYLIEERQNGKFGDAFAFCNETLVAIQSESEHLFLTRSLQFYGLKNVGFWTGAMYSLATGKHEWHISGSLIGMTFTAWAVGQPSNTIRPRIQLLGGVWYDAVAPERHHFLCESQ